MRTHSGASLASPLSSEVEISIFFRGCLRKHLTWKRAVSTEGIPAHPKGNDSITLEKHRILTSSTTPRNSQASNRQEQRAPQPARSEGSQQHSVPEKHAPASALAPALHNRLPPLPQGRLQHSAAMPKDTQPCAPTPGARHLPANTARPVAAEMRRILALSVLDSAGRLRLTLPGRRSSSSGLPSASSAPKENRSQNR